jgi:hypothetical protein
MNNTRKTSYFSAACPFALTISPSADGRFTYSAIDYSKMKRVLQKTYSTEEEAWTEGLAAAEEYAIKAVREQFAAVRRGDTEPLED